MGPSSTLTTDQLNTIKKVLVAARLSDLMQAQLVDVRNIAFQEGELNKYPVAFQCEGRDAEDSKKGVADRKGAIVGWFEYLLELQEVCP